MGTQKHRQRAVQVLFGTGGPPPGRDPVDVVDEMDDVALENGRTDGRTKIETKREWRFVK